VIFAINELVFRHTYFQGDAEHAATFSFLKDKLVIHFDEEQTNERNIS
jgi:hypothetical protein